MAQIQKPHHIAVTECVFPTCGHTVTDKVDHLPLCDRHMVEVYRTVQQLMDVVKAHQET